MTSDAQQILETRQADREINPQPVVRRPIRPQRPTAAHSASRHYARAQAVNIARHAAALRPFRRDEFGKTAASPTEGHIQAANRLLVALRRGLLAVALRVRQTAKTSPRTLSPARLRQLTLHKDQAGRWVKRIEKIWDYYFELFGQRQSRFGDWLVACDRVALDCYQVVFTGLGVARSIPSPGPFAYMETGFTPATYRRGIALTRLGKQINPFPVIQLPYHRLVNPWTLGAIHHEVSHNLQNDLGLWQVVPRRIYLRLRRAGIPAPVARIWALWHKETWADLSGLLLGGPAIVASLIDVVARAPRSTLNFNPAGVHPTPYLRVLISLELLRRIGFPTEAQAFHRLWRQLYPQPQRGNLPPALLKTFPAANRLVVDTICFQPYQELGGKNLYQVIGFKPGHQLMIQEAAGRLAAGTDPGILPPRFLVGAARWALDHQLTRPERITNNFYHALGQR